MRTDDSKKRNIVIYARVSTEHEAQIYALDNQMDWYDIILQSHPNWNIIAKYIDRGITGTSATKRPQFMKMIEESTDGAFDLIITREVSRFARNTVDTLQYTRQLKKVGVEVYFVEDNIWTFDPDGELRLTIMATLAQDESRKTSIRVKAGQRASMEKGVFFQNGSILGYDKAGNDMVINEEQAETVRMIYRLYNSGMGIRKIQFELEKAKRKTAMGKYNWSCSVISRILKNKFYAGYIIWYKQYVPDYLEQKKVNNHGQKEQFETVGTHEPIVSLEEWEMAQKRLASSRVENGGQSNVKQGVDIWCRKLKCICGHSFNRRQWHKDSSNGKKYYGYQCYSSVQTGTVKTRLNKGLPIEGICTTPTVSGWKLEAMATMIFKNLVVNKDGIVELAVNELNKHLKCDEEHKDVILSLRNNLDKYNKKLDNLIEMRMDGEISKQIFAEKKHAIELEIANIESQISEIDNTNEDILSISDHIDLLKTCIEELLDYDIEDKVPDFIIDSMVEYILVDDTTFKWKLRYIPDQITTTVNGTRKNHEVHLIKPNNSPYFANGNTGSNTQSAVNSIKVAEILFTKELAMKYMNKRPQDRIHRWQNLSVQIYI